jgi:multidrug efflux system membrane fusion protein
MNSWLSRRRLIVLAGIVILVALALVIRAMTSAHGADKPARQGAPSAVGVTTTLARTQSVPVYHVGVGTVTAMASVTVKARIDGQLDSVGFVEGQDVKAGQVLARLDPRTYEAQLAQAAAQKARDEAQLGNARADLKRYSTLIAEDAATQQQVDTQKALVRQLEAAVQTDDAAINYANVQLSFTTIKAPMGGRVGARLVDPGNIVHAADVTGLVVINQIDPITVLFTLPEEDFQDVNNALHANAAPLQVVAYPRNGSQPIGSGKLVLLNNQIDTTTGTVQMKGSFANPGHALWPGQYVNVRLVLRHEANAVTVPEAAVQRSQDGPFVWLVGAGDKAVNQPVKIGSIQDGIAVVDSGVKPGQRVVVDGQYKLKSGVAVVEAARGPGRGASAAASVATSATAAASGAGS